MSKLTIIILGENFKINENDNIEIIFANKDNLRDQINAVKTKYITFINSKDRISENYLDLVLDKISNDFDSCFINYFIEYNYINKPKIVTNEDELKLIKPYYGDYIWSFIFRTENFIKLLDCTVDNFNETVDSLFKNNVAIKDIIYYHNPRTKISLKNFCFCDVKDTYYCRNIKFRKD